MTQDHLSVDTAIEFVVPIRIESVNRTRDQHWSVRKRKTDEQRATLRLAGWCSVSAHERFHMPGPPYRVTLTRIAPRPLDDDNAVGGWKAIRDEIARILGVDDGDERITFRYLQERGRPKEYAARIRIETA